MKKILILIITVFLNTCFGEDFLLSLTNGAVSDNSPGIKVLSDAEASKVKGGYMVIPIQINSNTVVARTLITNFEARKGMLCGPGETTCAAPSQRRVIEWSQATDNSFPYENSTPYFQVTKEIFYQGGKPYVKFVYGNGFRLNGTFHDRTSHAMLNNNMVIREIKNAYKDSMESTLGGYHLR